MFIVMMATAQDSRRLTVLTIVNILKNSAKVVRALQKAIEKKVDRMNELQDELLVSENYVVEYLEELEDMEPEQLSKLKPFPGPSVITTLRDVSSETLLLRDLRAQLVAWTSTRMEQRRLLQSQDLQEYFTHYNNNVGFAFRDEMTRTSVLRGDSFMVSYGSGRVILTFLEAHTILRDYPGYLVRRRVKTVRWPEYDDFDHKGRMIDVGNRRCHLETIDRDEMLRVCHNRGQKVVPFYKAKLHIHSSVSSVDSDDEEKSDEHHEKRPRV